MLNIFIGTDDDALNSELADICDDCQELLDTDFVINRVTSANKSSDDINYVFM